MQNPTSPNLKDILWNLIIYQLPDKTVLKTYAYAKDSYYNVHNKFNSVTKELPTIGLLEKLDDSDDRFIIRKVEKKDKIKSRSSDSYYDEPTYNTYNYTIHIYYVTVEIDLEWRLNQLDKLKERKDVTAGIFYFCLTMLFFSFILIYSQIFKIFNGFFAFTLCFAFLGALLYGFGLKEISNEKYKFTEYKNN